jgi:hypothetical protein
MFLLLRVVGGILVIEGRIAKPATRYARSIALHLYSLNCSGD